MSNTLAKLANLALVITILSGMRHQATTKAFSSHATEVFFFGSHGINVHHGQVCPQGEKWGFIRGWGVVVVPVFSMLHLFSHSFSTQR